MNRTNESILKVIGGFRQLLNRLYDIQDSAWSLEKEVPQNVENLREHKYWASITREELEDWLSSPNQLDINFSNKIMYLPPLEKDDEFLPMLSLYCKLSERTIDVRFYVILVRFTETGEPYGIGFRLETPVSKEDNQDEGKNGKQDKSKKRKQKDRGDGQGRHDFYHAQFINKAQFIDKYGAVKPINPPIKIPCWLPCEQPSFPLTADCPVTLIFSLLLTLYGKKYCLEFYNHFVQSGTLKKYKDKLDGWIHWDS